MNGERTALGRQLSSTSRRHTAAFFFAGFAVFSSAYAQEAIPADLGDPPATISEAGEVAGGTGIGTSSLLVTSTECSPANPSCSAVDAVVRFNGSTGAYIGVHIPSIQDPWAMAIHPIRESLMVVSRSDATVREYDANNGALVRVLVTPGAEGLHLPQGIAFTPTGRMLVSSNQASGQLTKFNGILEFNSDTGAFISNFVDGGSSASESCSNPICLRGPGALIAAPNSRIYVISVINDSVQEYNFSGVFQGAFTSAKLIGPSGLARRPSGTNAGNILVASQYINPDSPFDDTIVEFSGVTRTLVSTNGGVLASGMIRPGPLAWHTDGHLLVGERTDNIPPSFPFNADRVSKRNGASGANMGQFTAAGDTHVHGLTSILHTHVNYATDDADSDGDTDLKDLASLQNCFPFSTTTQCLTPFDDNRTGTIGRWDFLAFIGNFHGPRRPCITPADCNDNDVCSVDACVGGFCSYTSAADGTVCADNLFCDGSETCRSGVCRGKSPCIDEAHCNEATDVCRQCLVSSECNDNNPCTDDSCTASFTCQFTAHSRSCNDGNSCTTNDKCSAGACVGGPPPNCNDNNICSTDTCDPVLGCIHTDNLLPCDDGNACSQQDFCLQGTCRQGRERDCDDDNPCTDDTCNTISGCLHQNNTDTCDDSDPCTDSDTCQAGVCRGTAKNCSDSVSCTVDRCINGVCQNSPENSRCSNGNWCDGTEICNATQGCLPGTPPCNDNIPCTVDNCDPDAQTCTRTPNNAACSNGLFCDGVETCSLTLGCQAGTAVNCSAQNGPCTTGVCNESADVCDAQPKPVNTTCDDGLFCTVSDRCNATGSCNVTTPRDCSAQTGQCTNGVCNETADACEAQPKPVNTTCDDGLFCTVGDKCNAAGLCNVTTPRDCSAQNGQCTTGQCNEATDACFAQAKPVNTACDDGLFCTVNDMCNAGGSCVLGIPRDCSSLNTQCADGVCDEAGDACTTQNLPNGTGCNDGQFCTVTDQCVGGTCGGSGARCTTAPNLHCNEAADVCDECVINADCNDNNPCTNDTCTNGECFQFANTNACDDGLFCTANDVCSGGSCAGQEHCPASCDEQANQCVECLNVGDCTNDSNPCTDLACVDGSCEFTDNTASCNDGLLCTINDSCLDGVCGGDDACPGQLCNSSTGACVDCLTAADCPNDANVCTDRACNAGTCGQVNNTAGCNDGLLCTINDSCVNGVCDGEDACPGQLCNPSNGACVDCLTATDCPNDADVCTDRICNAGACGQVNNTANCNDGSLCTINDSCLDGTCGGEDACPGQLCNPSNGACVECLSAGDCPDDSSVCTDRACDAGTCGHVNNTATCNDGSLCTVNDSCLDGTCGGEDACPGGLCNPSNGACVECLTSGDCTADSNPCTDTVCSNGFCDDVNNSAACSDGLVCTINDHCSNGVCDSDPRVCNDGFSCTTDTCDEPNGCVFTPNDNACNDSQYCNGEETCAAGNVAGLSASGCLPGEPVVCNDGIACTSDSCSEAIEDCVFTPDDEECADGNFCNGEEACNPNVGCVAGSDPCALNEFCDEGSNQCVECLIDADCNDDLFCTGVESCSGGTCSSGGSPCALDETCDEDADTCVPDP